MLTDDEIQKLAADLESDRVERKESLSGSSKDRIGQAICAFANDFPGHKTVGVLMIGVNDAGVPTGLPITDALLIQLAGFRSEGNILPLPSMTVEKRRLAGREIAIVEVSPSGDPPVRYYGQVWIRVGPRRAIASRDEERVLTERRRSGNLPFDQQPVSFASSADLDLHAFREVYLPSAISRDQLGQDQRSDYERLAALHLLAPDGTPNHAAILLFSSDPRRWIPGAYVQFVRFDGADLSCPILDQKELSGPAAEVLRRIDELASVNVRFETAITGASTEIKTPDYPVDALQQLLRNAVLHRTYEVFAPVHWYWFSDRVEIHSPGGLYGRVNETNFGEPHATDYRNPTLAEGFKVLGFVQRFGVGIALARSRCREGGNPPPSFEFSPSAVLAVVRRRT